MDSEEPLIVALDDEDVSPQTVAVALASIGHAAVAAIPKLVATIKSGRDSSGYGLMAIGAMGPNASEAVPDLIAILSNRGSEAELRSAAAWALGKIGLLAIHCG